MKTILSLLITCLTMATTSAYAQCTTAALNWDFHDYYYNSGVDLPPYGTPGGNYVSNAMEQTQRFAIGPVDATFVTSAAGMVKGEVGTQTGFTGDDAQFKMILAQTITITFSSEVSTVAFNLYDIDNLEIFTLSAKNAANTGVNVQCNNPSSGNVGYTNNNSPSVTLTGNSADAAVTSVDKGVSLVTIAGPVKTITFTFTSAGTSSNNEFYLGDISACVPGSFPVNYQQTPTNAPLTGPVVNQPDYFFVSPDNDSVYTVDPATGKAWYQFADPEKTYVNSLSYDPVSRYMYYVSDISPAVATNKKIKRYDFLTNTTTVLSTDVTALLNIPTFDGGVEGGGGAFYDNKWYFGIEGGRHLATNTTRENIIYRISMDASGNPTSASQVWASNATNGSGSVIIDWADFVVKNGVLINFNSKGSGGTWGYEHFDLMTSTDTKYNLAGVSQAGMDYAGNVYDYSVAGFAKYNENGTRGAYKTISMFDGSFWKGGVAGDAAENFRPPMDFGDAPVSYDPVAGGPAASEIDPKLHIGAAESKEWDILGRNATATVDADDGLSFVPVFNPNNTNYLVTFNVFNNTGASATVFGWFDYNANGVFEASEALSQVVPSSATPTPVSLYWTRVGYALPMGSFTYLRLRVAPTSAAMTSAHATGFFRTGEVEDYRVIVNFFPLAEKNCNLSATLTPANTGKIAWQIPDQSNVTSYVVEKSRNGSDWAPMSTIMADAQAGIANYETLDNAPFAGTTYYRLHVMPKSGNDYVSPVKKIQVLGGAMTLTIAPNPAKDKAVAYVNTDIMTSTVAHIEIIGAAGNIVHSETQVLSGGTKAIDLPSSRLQNGRYLVRITVGGRVITQTLVISK